MRPVAYLDQSHLDPASPPELYHLDRERDLVALVAAHRGFELGTVYEAASGATRQDAFAALGAGEAEALIVPRGRAVRSSREELIDRLTQRRQAAWELCVVDVGI